MKTPNVNFFIHSVPYLKGEGINSKLTKKYDKERQFYSCGQSYNFVSYVNDGSKRKIDFVDYSGNNEKSSGIFNKDGLCNNMQIKETRQSLKSTKSPIWHGLISFEEVFGNTYCNSFEKAVDLMKKEFPKFFTRAGFYKNNIVWFAGFHTNTNHKHIHFSFYEKEPLKYRRTQNKKCFSYGQVCLNAIEQMKLNTELHLMETNTKIIKSRKELTEQFKNSISSQIKKREIFNKMKKISNLIPSKGRVSYDSESLMFFKNDINYLVDQIIKGDKNTNAIFRTYLTLLSDKDKSIRRMCLASKINPSKVVLFEKYKKDLYRRLGNQVIKEIIHSNHELEKLDFFTKNRLTKKRIQRNKIDYLLNESLHLSEKVCNEAQQCFKEHMRTLEEMKIKVLIEQGIIEL